MSYVPVSTGAVVAATAAHAAQVQAQAEEERSTPYTEEELLADYEFKIVRAATRVFHEPEFLQQVLEEEARSGWTLLEKFDDQRIRLKRPAEAKRQDASLRAQGLDPYRTSVAGANSSARGLTIAGVVLLVCAGLVVLAMMAK